MDIFGDSFSVTFFIAALLIFLWYWKGYRKQCYWKDRGVPYDKMNTLVAFWEDRFENKPAHEARRKYFSTPPVYGYFNAGFPTLCVKDPLLIKNILVKDFHIFPNRRPIKFGDRLHDNFLAFIEGEDWKRVRTILSPSFSPAKFRALFDNFNSCSKTLIKNFKNYADKQQAVDMKKIFAVFAMDLATSSLFSVKIDSLNYQESELIKIAESTSHSITWRIALYNYCPELAKFFKISFLDPVRSKYFWNVALQIIEERKGKKENRNDFVQHLIDFSEDNDGTSPGLKNEDGFTNNCTEEILNQQKDLNRSSKKTLTKDEVVSQCAMFVRAGFTTTGSRLAIASYLLALHEDVQNKAREEIAKFMDEAKGELTYDALQNMKYIDNVISEVLRMYPVSYYIERRAETDYQLGDTGMTIQRGTIISIPGYCLQHDPKHFPNPDKFDPNRFTAEEKAKRDPYVYMPFGIGPRNCIGMRFTQVQLKLGLVYLIRCFKIKTCPQTQIPLKLKRGSTLIRTEDIFLLLEPTPECELVLNEG